MAAEIYLRDSYGGPEGQNIAAFHKMKKKTYNISGHMFVKF